MVLRRVMIANRGEIAVRVIRTCTRLGIESVLAAALPDMDSVAARCATRVICIGAAKATGSYLNVGAVMAAAASSGADAIHPGYGFLSENQALARACESAGRVFIGPTVAQLAAVGDKLSARRHAIEAGLPVVPGGDVEDRADALRLAGDIGYPLLLKAVAGGGGRGMKLVHCAADLPESMDRAAAEAHAAFGDPRVYLERYVASGRHIEVQILGDGVNILHLGTRDCSIQRRYQKLVEEAPAPHLDGGMREAMQAAAVRFARHLSYRGLGTVEFLFDVDRAAFYFLEMNARIQVEHPVTEMICGLDLVEQQIRVAEGHALAFGQADVTLEGHAIECRINAENWRADFRPSPGRIQRACFAAGDGVRVDTHVQAGTEVTPHYDSLLAKIIVRGADRAAALENLTRALERCDIAGIDTTLSLQRLLMRQPAFASGGVTTGYFQTFLDARARSGA